MEPDDREEYFPPKDPASWWEWKLVSSEVVQVCRAEADKVPRHRPIDPSQDVRGPIQVEGTLHPPLQFTSVQCTVYSNLAD